MSLVLNVPEFWIYKGSRYASGFEYARILNTPEFWICQGYKGFKICLIMSEYAWLCQNMSEYAGICVNKPKSAWMAFISQFPCGYITFLDEIKFDFFCSRWKYYSFAFFLDYMFLQVRFKFAITFWGPGKGGWGPWILI